MSESDSFISEVTEEVRRETFYRTLRRYGWLIGLVVVAIIGGAAWHEWTKARDRAASEAAGDALQAALALADPAARADALAALPAGPAAPLIGLAEAGARLEAGDAAAAAALFERVGGDGGAPEIYRALASLQRVMALGPELAASERLGTLDGLAAENGPLRLLALEQRALVRIETGEAAAAQADLQEIVASPTAPEGLRARAQQLIIATGGAPETPAAPGG